MAFIKEVWLTYLGNSLFSQILVVIVTLLILILIYLLIRRIIHITGKMKKDAEKKEITHIKQREGKIMRKLKRDKEETQKKISTLKKKSS